MFLELETDWESDVKDNEMFDYMKRLITYFHHGSEGGPIDKVLAFKIFTVVTLRQTLTQLTQNVHSQATQATRDIFKMRK